MLPVSRGAGASQGCPGWFHPSSEILQPRTELSGPGRPSPCLRTWGLRDEVLSAQANYTCGIWAADCPVTPYLMRKRQPKQLFKTKCHRGISFAGSQPARDCFSHSLSHLEKECGLRRPAVGGRARQGCGGQAGRSLPGVRPVPPRHGPARGPNHLTFLFTKPSS